MQKILEKNYKQYISGEITQKEYLHRIKPIDEEIGRLEMATHNTTLLLKSTPLS